MRIQIAYTLIALMALAVLLLVARSRSRKVARPRKHLRIDIIAERDDGAPQAAADAKSSSFP